MAKSRQEEIVLARMIEMQNKLDKYDDAVLIKLKKEYKKASERLLEDVKAAKNKTKRIWTNTRLTALLEEAQITHQAVVGLLTGQTAEAMVEVGAYSYKTMNNIVGWDGKVLGYNNISLSPQQLQGLVTEQKLAGKNLKDWMGDALSADIDSIKTEVAQGLIRGEGYDKMVSRLRQELGIERGSRQERDLETVVKTYTQAINGKAQQDVYNANDIVSRLEWSAIMENGNIKTGRGTCPRCIALDGLIWAKDDLDRPPMPLHPRCRCMFLPVTKTWKELGLDIDEMEKEYQPWTVRDDAGNIVEHGFEKNYSDWFKTRGKEFQDRAIGPKRAELYREGKIQLKDLVDKKGNLILLAELTGEAIKTATESSLLRLSSFSLFNVGSIDRDEFIDAMNSHSKEQIEIIKKLEKPDSIALDPLHGTGKYYFGTKQIVYNTKRGSFTLKHEYGHHIDNVAKPKNAVSWSTGSKEFKDAIDADRRRLGIHPDDFNTTEFWKLYDEFTYRDSDNFQRAIDDLYGIQDSLDAMAIGQFNDAGLFGHGSEYFNNYKQNVELEIFANFWEMYGKEKEWKKAKEMFPETTKAFSQFIKKGGK